MICAEERAAKPRAVYPQEDTAGARARVREYPALKKCPKNTFIFFVFSIILAEASFFLVDIPSPRCLVQHALHGKKKLFGTHRHRCDAIGGVLRK